MNGALARGVGSLYVSTDCMDEDAIAKAVKAAAARRRDHPHPNLVKIARHQGGINLADRTDSFGVSHPISMPFMI